MDASAAVPYDIVSGTYSLKGQLQWKLNITVNTKWSSGSSPLSTALKKSNVRDSILANNSVLLRACASANSVTAPAMETVAKYEANCARDKKPRKKLSAHVEVSR